MPAGALSGSAFIWPFFHPSSSSFLSLYEHVYRDSYLILILAVCPVQVRGLSTQVGFSPRSAFEAQRPNCSYDSSWLELFLITDLTDQLPLAIIRLLLASILSIRKQTTTSLSHVVPLGTLRVLHPRRETPAVPFIPRDDDPKIKPQRHPDRTVYPL